MTPRLAVISGPLKGRTFPLSGEFSIGRERTNQLCLADASVSRRHCLIRADEAGRFTVTDLESLNSTFVNDVPVKERTLEHSDRLRVGESLFLFQTREEDPGEAQTFVQFDERLTTGDQTIQMHVAEAFHLIARDFSALMKISTTISSIRSLDKLQRRLLELIFEVLPAERGAILLIEEDGKEFATVFGLDKLRGPDHTIPVSRTVADQVLTEGIALLSNDVSENQATSTSNSLVSSETKSLLCVPLMLYEKPLGLIYFDTSNPSASFDKDHLQLVAAVAGLAAIALDNARRFEWLEQENQRLRDALEIEHNMVGESAPMRQVYQTIARVAPTAATVLITGESGTGKELATRAIHLNSTRKERPFVAVNCAALTESLLESELFGHEKGAFTGAISQRKGKLETAHGGTLFLDEVGEMSQMLQVKLLRVLQEREFERVGGTKTIKVDIRLVAATNRDLQEAVKQGAFRQDLFYRLNVVALNMPPLRERREDIPLLASYFVAKYSQKCNRKVVGLSPEARTRLVNYDWPGNVRELENTIERAVVLGTSDRILAEDLPESMLEIESAEKIPATKYHEAVQDTKKQLILNAIEAAQGNYTEAARLLELHPNYLHRLIRNMNLRPEIKGK